MLKKVFAVITASLLAASCSLNYGRDTNTESSIPEFSFKDATFKRIENGVKKVSMTASQLEQYKSDNSSFAKDVEFSTFDEQGQIDTEGKCGLLSSDTKNKKYGLYKDINLNIHSQEMEISAQALKFDGKSEQLTSSREDEVTITKSDMETKGRGFSASGVSNTFSFMYEVSGETR